MDVSTIISYVDSKTDEISIKKAQRDNLIEQNDFLNNKISELEEEITLNQEAGAVDSHAIPTAWDMPGYEDQVIMASPSFIDGSSIELSADAPMREPYAGYYQGGLTYEHVKIALMNVLKSFNKK